MDHGKTSHISPDYEHFVMKTIQEGISGRLMSQFFLDLQSESKADRLGRKQGEEDNSATRAQIHNDVSRLDGDKSGQK